MHAPLEHLTLVTFAVNFAMFLGNVHKKKLVPDGPASGNMQTTPAMLQTLQGSQPVPCDHRNPTPCARGV